MNGRLAEAQLGREARRIFRKLGAPDAYLTAAPEGTGFAVFAGPQARRPLLTLDTEVMRSLLSRGWLVPRGTAPERWGLSEAGIGWYVRAQAEADPFAAQHQSRREAVLDEGGGERRVTINDAESPLAWLKRRGHIDAAQFAAGEKLRRDYTLAQLSPRLGVDLTAPLTGGRRGLKAPPLSETVLAAKQRFSAAMKAAGPGLNDVLFDVCCHLHGLEDIERQHAWPRRSGKVVLDIALNRLALHYGMRLIARRHAAMRAWAAEETCG